jgi:tetratricopeptide (TPR) repeat protein
MRAPVRGTHALLGMHGPVAVLQDRLRTLCERGWLRPVDAPEPCHEFLGETLREAAYATLPEDERALGHRLVAGFLVASGDPDPVVLAGHAERGGDPELAAASWARAAARALTGNDLSAAFERSDRGLPLARTAETRGALRAVAAAVHRWRGEYGPALDAALEALAGLEASAPERFDALATAISAAGALGRVEDLGRFVDVALEEGPPDTLGPRVVSLCRVAALALGRGDDGQATDLLAQAEALHLRCRDEAPIASAWLDVLRASRALREGDVGAFVARTQSAVDGYERAGDARDACNQRVRLANGWAALGEPGRAEPVVRAALAEAQRIGLPLVEGYAWQNLGHVLFLLGRTGEARAALERAQRAGRALRDASLEAGALVYLSDLALASGAYAEALAHARQAFERVGAHAMGCVASSAAALACVALGAFDEAARWAAEAQRGTALPGGLEEGEARVRLAQLEVARAAAAGPSSQGLAREAASWLRARASKISDPALREGFLHRVPEHARLLALGEPA